MGRPGTRRRGRAPAGDAKGDEGARRVLFTCACGDGCRQRTTYRSAGARCEPRGFAGPPIQTCCAREGTLLMDERSRGANTVPALLLDHVVQTYGPVRAVDGVSFTAHPGEFIALLGPNGAGKSTLFQLLSGLFVPDSGRIEVMGHDMTRKPVPALARLGIVFQQPTLDLELSVTSNLLFHAGLHGIPRGVAKARIEKELMRLGLSDRANDKTATLSGGNRRRVELARALLHEPRVLLMDEATVGLDPASRSDLLKFILALRSE